jgi:hypothetical protein
MEQWQALVAAFRAAPGNAAAARRAVPNLCSRTIRRAWSLGIAWANYPPARIPIRVTLEAEAEQKRAALVREEVAVATGVRKDARDDAEKTQLAEAQMVRLARASTTGLLASLVKISAGAAKVGDAVADSISSLGVVKDAEGKPRLLTLQEVRGLVSLLARVGQTLKQVTDAAQGVIESERLVLGEPTQILGVVHRMDDITQEEADRRINAAVRALERVKTQGLFGAEPARVRVLEATLKPTDKDTTST